MKYNPEPILMSKESIPTDIANLIELLAKNVHEEWAAGRIQEGWSYGTERNDKLKEHPTLVPYEDLPESEKEYDRRTVMTTISYLIANGYSIVKK